MYIQICIGLVCVVNLVHASYSEQFYAALEAQNKKQYRQAFDLYCTMPVKTGNSFFNMGLIAYYEGQYVKALALWRTACSTHSIFDGYHLLKRASAAIAQLKQEQQVSTEYGGHPADDSRFLYHALFVVIWYLHIIPLWIFHVFVLIVGLCMAGFLLFSMHNTTVFRRWIILIGLFFGILISIALYTIKIRNIPYAVVQEPVEMYRGPGDFFESAGRLCSLTEVLVEARSLGWCKVRYQDKMGWVPEKGLYIIDDHAICGIDIVNRSDNH